MKYKLLNITHPEYEELETRKLQLLYEGGHEILEHANLFIPKEGMETQASYHNRLQCASYKNYFSEIINSYTSEVFNKTLTVMPAADADDKSTKGTSLEYTTDDFYQDFAENADLKGTPLVNLLKSSLSESMVTGKSLIQIDFPKSDIKPLSLIEEEELGTARAYLIILPTLSMIDWSIDEVSGTYNFVVLKSEYTERTSLDQSRDMKTVRFKIWQKENNIVFWKVYELKIKCNKQPKPDDEFELVDEGIVSFPEIPIICLECPRELWVGNLIGTLCADHFKRYSSLIHAENRNLFSIPVYQQGPEVSSSGSLSELAMNSSRGQQSATQMRHKGFAVTGPEDKIYFAEPDGRSYQLVNDQLKELVDEIHRVNHLMANSISGSKNANSVSGLSKIMDNRSKEIVLTAYGELAKAYIIKLYKLISAARNEPVMWRVLGLDDYRLTMDREQLLKEAVSVQLINIPSKTFKKALYVQIATQFIDSLTPQEQLVIEDEISKGVDSMNDNELYGINEEEDDGMNVAFDSKKPAKSTESE